MEPEEASRVERSHAEILKSTAVIGAASIINVFLGLVRSKVVAVLLGPSGVGLISLFNSIIDLTQALTNLGIQSSGVRQVAVAAGTGDRERIAQISTVLRRVSLILGLIGGALLVSFALPVSELTFGDRKQRFGVALLAGAVFFRSLATGFTAMIQGMRRVAYLAKVNILAALSATVSSTIFIYFFAEGGIVPSFIFATAISALVSWWYFSKLKISQPKMKISQMLPETATLLRLGFAFTVSELLTLGSAYIVRVLVFHFHGIEAAGLYQAAWTLGSLYTGFILQAMGADFYPRLAGASQDNNECNRLVNEQTHISILLAGPGIIATLTFAPLILTAFYSSEFQPGVELVRWICFGMGLRVIAWPIGFILLAKGAQRWILLTELWAATVHIGLGWVFISSYSFIGAGVAFFALYVSHTLVIYGVARHISGFRWTAANLFIVTFFLLSSMATFGSFYVLSFWHATAVSTTILAINSTVSFRTLIRICSLDMFPAPMRPWLARFVNA